MMGRGTKLLLAMLATFCIAVAFLSPLFASRAPLAHGKNCDASGYVLAPWSALLIANIALMTQIRRAGAKSARASGADLLALTCTRLC